MGHAHSKDDFDQLKPDERLDALAEVLAEGFLHLVMTGQLAELLAEPIGGAIPANNLMSGGKECKVSNGP